MNARYAPFNLVYWLVFYTLLWMILAGGAGWLFGAACVALATGLTLWLDMKPWRLHVIHLPAFAGFFLRELTVGGWDVARRALHPAPPLSPAWVDYSLHTHDERVRLLLSAIVGLLPGTFSTGVEGDTLVLHVLDDRCDWVKTTASLERHLDRLLGGFST